jgi:hypothetical protein
MKNNRLLNFLDEIRMQCRFIVRAAPELDDAVAMQVRDPTLEEFLDPQQLEAALRPTKDRSEAVWFAAQQLIVAHGIVSTLLWDKADAPGGPLKRSSLKPGVLLAYRVAESVSLESLDPLSHFGHRNGTIGGRVDAAVSVDRPHCVKRVGLTEIWTTWVAVHENCKTLAPLETSRHIFRPEVPASDPASRDRDGHGGTGVAAPHVLDG